MIKYCERCKDFHEDGDLCPKYKEQLRQHPEWLGEAANFASVAAQYELITSQALDGAAKTVNNLVGSNLSYEGTHQAVHDIMTFRQLHVDPYSKIGVFGSPETAQEYVKSLEHVSTLKAKLGGTSHEVDVLLRRKGEWKGLISKTELLGEGTHNAPGVDGVTKVYKLFGGGETRFSVKSTQYNVSPRHSTINSVFHSIDQGTFRPNDVLEGTEGYKKAFFDRLDEEIRNAASAGDTQRVHLLEQFKNTKVIESGSAESVAGDAQRLFDKAKSGNANITVTPTELTSKMAQGAVIGAVVALTVSSITNYIRYKNGEITEQEAFRDVGEDATKGLLTGAAMAGATLFLPAGPLGFAAGMAIGIYIGTTCTNVLDEVFGKGAYEQILNACGYIEGTARNVEEMLKEYQHNIQRIDTNLARSRRTRAKTKKTLDEADDYLAIAEKWREGR